MESPSLDKETTKSSILFEDPNFCDFTLRLEIIEEENNGVITRGKRKRNDVDEEDAEIMKVNKTLLVIKSNYFHKMMQSWMKEQQESEATIGFESELERTTFKQFIRFFYTKEIPNEVDLKTFLKLADRFDYYKAIASVAKKMPNNLTIAECCEWLDMLSPYQDKQEIQDAIKKIEQSLVTHVGNFNFKEEDAAIEKLCKMSSKNAVMLLLGSDLLMPYSEDVIFRAAYQWYIGSQTEVEQLSELAPVFRWNHMSCDFLRCISTLPEAENDGKLLLGIIDGLHSRTNSKKPLTPNTRKVYDKGRTTLFTMQQNSPLNQIFCRCIGGYLCDVRVVIENQQLTVAVSKVWPPQGECTIPFRKVTVTEDGNDINYKVKSATLKDETESQLSMKHPILNANEQQMKIGLTYDPIK